MSKKRGVERKVAAKSVEKSLQGVERHLLLREFEQIKELSMSGISKMMRTGTLTAENVEMLSLELAAFYGLTRVMKVLLTTGEADVNRVHSKTGDTALHWAARGEQIKMISLLKKYGAVSKTNKKSETPEKIALIIKNESVQKCLGCFVAVDENDGDVGLSGADESQDADVSA